MFNKDYFFYGSNIEMHYAYRMLYLTNIIKYAQHIHNLSSDESLFLGEVMLSGILLSSLLDTEDRINLKIQVNDLLSASVEVTRHSEIKAYIEYNKNSVLYKDITNINQKYNFIIRSIKACCETTKLPPTEVGGFRLRTESPL